MWSSVSLAWRLKERDQLDDPDIGRALLLKWMLINRYRQLGSDLSGLR